jgi:CRP-like cAMP-binding protein
MLLDSLVSRRHSVIRRDGQRVSVSREELAQLTATSSFTVYRLLSKWEENGIVTAVRRAVLVRNLPALRQVAQTESLRPSDNCAERRLPER